MTKARAANGGWRTRAPQTMQDGSRAVGFNFDNTGGNLFGDLTTHWFNVAKQHTDVADPHSKLAIVLDNKIISAPNLNYGESPAARASSPAAARADSPRRNSNYLINTLNAGSLPAQLSDEPISEQQVGPTLGADNLYRGLVACGFGLIVVAVFLISYYYLAGVVAFFAVLMNLVLILGTMCALNATFTLPSIAGIVLTDRHGRGRQRADLRASARRAASKSSACAWPCATATPRRKAPSSTPT